jgi:HlyD family secretion protein
MNGDVSLAVDRRSQVLAVPVDAVRSLREAQVLAPTLGLQADSVSAQLTRQRTALAASGGSRGAGGWRDSIRAGGAGDDSSRAERRRAWRGRRGQAGSRAGGGGFASGSGGASRAQVVFVKTAKGIEPRLVRLGLSDFDWSQVVTGVKEGDQVVLLGVAEAQASRTQQQANVRQRVGSMPGGIGGGGGRRGGS